MAILEQSQYDYYNNPSAFGNYQFTSLEDIINQFMVVYVGEEKIISKSSRTDIRFHAQRALAELSFDTFKSIKSQEIELPPSLTMPLPHDYVNYTRVLCVDNAGIKKPLYPTKHTQNPFAVKQEDDGSYDFLVDGVTGFLKNYNFEENSNLPASGSPLEQWIRKGPFPNPSGDSVKINNNKLEFIHGSKNFPANADPTLFAGGVFSRAYTVYQQIDVTDSISIDLTATATSAAASAGIKGNGLVRVGVTTLNPSNTNQLGVSFNIGVTCSGQLFDKNGYFNCAALDPTIFNLTDNNGNPSYVEYSDGATSTLSLENIDTESIPVDANGKKYLYVVVVSTVQDFTTVSTSSTLSTNTVDSIVISSDSFVTTLQEKTESTTWSNYKANKPSENKQHDYDYDDHIFEANVGRRYGLDPAHAQDNGSYYVDNLRGKIHFSSNLSGKTIVLDYISDSLGTDGEMQVHKFAEEAMYKSIIYAILSTRINTPEYIIRRYKKERFAEIRKAKLRLSNIKLEEITQIFRGKSKQIKH